MGKTTKAEGNYPVAIGKPIDATVVAATAPPPQNPQSRLPAGGFGRAPVITTCPNCKNQTQTRYEDHVTLFTLSVMVLLFYFAWPICWLPIFLSDLKSCEHYCKRCNFLLAKKRYPWSKSKAY